MGCSCKDSQAEIEQFYNMIGKFREMFIHRMTIDSETTDRRRADYNQAIFFEDDDGEYKQVFNETNLDMIMDCFANAVMDYRKSFCDTKNCRMRKYYER